VLVVLVEAVCIVPQADRGPVAIEVCLEHDRVADRRSLGPAITDADIGIEVDEDLPRPSGHRRST